MILKGFNFNGCLSYIISFPQESTAIIIDPSHQIAPYLNYLEANYLKVLYIIDNQTHLERVSLAPELGKILDVKTIRAAHILPQQLLAKINQEEIMFLLDVRQPEEFADHGFISGARNIPVQELAERVKELPQDLAYPVIAICESGSRSAYAVLYLNSCGYTEVKNLAFGMREWQSLGYPLTFPK